MHHARVAARGVQPAALALALALGCATDDGSDPDDMADGSSSAAASSEGSAGGSSGAGGSDESSGEGEGGSSSGGESLPQPTTLPTPTGVCPTLAAGDVELTPAGIPPRTVRVWMSDAAATMPGPLVFYWHGTGSQPLEAEYGLGNALIEQVVAQGGIVVAPTHDPAAGDFPWFLVLGSQEDDLLVADELLGCALEQTMVDVRRIHTIGMSAGGLQSAQMSFRRSGYIASAVTYSGGLVAGVPPDQDPGNPMSAMIFHGGETDVVLISFQQASESYLDALRAKGGFGFLCDHGMGHSIPQGDAQPSVWTFFYDHPFGTTPSPYVGGLPQGFPSYCTL